MAEGWRKRDGFFFFLVFLSLILFFADKREWLGSARGWLERPILAIQQSIFDYHVSIDDNWEVLVARRQRAEDILKLEGKLRQLAVEQSELAACREENERMRQLLGAPLPPAWKFLPAYVVGVADNKIRLGQGTEAGVEEGMMVVAENILVGQVVSATRQTGLVQLPISPETKIPVVVKQPGSVGVQARGLLLAQSGGLILDRVLQAEDIQKGDLVLTVGDETWLANLLIGQIDDVLPKTAELYQKARVKPLVDYQKLRIVFIVISK